MDADNRAKAFVYDDASQLKWVVTDVEHDLNALPNGPPNNWSIGPSGPRLSDSTLTEYRYNELGQQTHQVDARNNTTTFTYDAL